MCCTALLIAASGCKPATPTASSVAPVPLPAVARGTPQEAARTVLETVLAEQAALASKNMPALSAARSQLRSLAASQMILSRVPKDRLSGRSDQLLTEVVESWGRILAYYGEPVRIDAATVVANSDTQQDVLVPVGTPPRAATLRVECLNENGAWNVIRIDYAVGSAASQPSHAPASRAIAAPANSPP